MPTMGDRMDPDQQRIFEIVKANALKVLVDLKPEDVTLDKSLADLGANSVDRVEVVMYSMEDLNLNVPKTELHGVRDLRGLVELLRRHASPKAS